MESCQDFRTSGKVFESSRAGTGDFLEHEPDHPFAVTTPNATMFRDMCKESRCDLVASVTTVRRSRSCSDQMCQ
jgi:hypothetical protein